MHRHVIWSSDVDVDDYKEWLEEEYPDASETEKLELAEEANDMRLDDERENLNIQLNDDILVIANLGLWNGRHSGYKVLSSGNIKDCLYSNADYNTWYLDDRGDL